MRRAASILIPLLLACSCQGLLVPDLSRLGRDGVVIPDEYFRAYTLKHFDTDEDGILQQDEADAVGQIDFVSDDAQSVEGIQHFPNLTSILISGKEAGEKTANGKIKSIDLSCNPELGRLSLMRNQITSLDLSHNTALSYIDLYCNKLSRLDVSMLDNLEFLSIFGNQFTHFQLSDSHIKELHVDSNMLEDLVLDCPQLEYLNCSGNNLTFLDLTKCPRLERADFTDNPGLKVIYLKSGQVIGEYNKDASTAIEYID